MQRGEAQIAIEAPPETVYALVADVTRMGEWSPECYRCAWLDGATGPAVGARFRGYNRWRGCRWSRTVVVTVADPGREFEFETVPTRLYRDSTRWRYRFAPRDRGTLVTESFEVTAINRYLQAGEVLVGRAPGIVPAMQRTLERLKAAAETGARRAQPEGAGASPRRHDHSSAAPGAAVYGLPRLPRGDQAVSVEASQALARRFPDER